MTYATLFSGGELAGCGARAAGLDHIWGYEIDPAIAAVANTNGFSVHTADVLSVDPRQLEVPTFFHCSPPCPNFSIAKTNRAETPLDIALGEKVSEFIDVLAPKVVTLENVYAYRDSVSFAKVKQALDRGGYWWTVDHVNASDYGVPQTRRRLILRAVRGGWVPALPEPEPWIGWYAAIEDLIPTLPTAWHKRGQACEHDPAGRECRKSEHCRGHFAKWQEARAVVASSAMPRAFLVDGGGSNGFTTVTVCKSEDPCFTVVARSDKLAIRAWLSQGRVVSMTPRALARFQSVSDWYVLPDKKSLATKIIGNGVSCLMFQKLIAQLMAAVSA